MDDDVLCLVSSITMAMSSPLFSWIQGSSYGMTNPSVFHLNEYFFSAHLIESDGCKLEGRLWLRHHESLGFNICERHVDILVLVSIFPLLFNLTVKSKTSNRYTGVPENLHRF